MDQSECVYWHTAVCHFVADNLSQYDRSSTTGISNWGVGAIISRFNHDRMLHIKVRLPVLLCAVKTVEGDFRFCWTITPNVGQTHKENPN